jgi:hypothetical protein
MPSAQVDLQIVTRLARAEAHAQAKLMVKEVSDQFNLIRKGDVEGFDRLAQAVNKLGCMVEVLIQLACDPTPLNREGRAEDKRHRFEAMCDAQMKKFKEQVNG